MFKVLSIRMSEKRIANEIGVRSNIPTSCGWKSLNGDASVQRTLHAAFQSSPQHGLTFVSGAL